jgi:hypothetical protein
MITDYFQLELEVGDDVLFPDGLLHFSIGKVVAIDGVLVKVVLLDIIDHYEKNQIHQRFGSDVIKFGAVHEAMKEVYPWLYI